MGSLPDYFRILFIITFFSFLLKKPSASSSISPLLYFFLLLSVVIRIIALLIMGCLVEVRGSLCAGAECVGGVGGSVGCVRASMCG